MFFSSLEAFVKYATPEFIKAFQVAQMLLEYLRFQSETLVGRILQMNDEYPSFNAMQSPLSAWICSVRVRAWEGASRLSTEGRREGMIPRMTRCLMSLQAEEISLLKKHIQKVTDELQVILKEYTRLDQLVKKYSKVQHSLWSTINVL